MEEPTHDNPTERRIYHRYDCDLPVTIIGLDEGQLACRSANISLSGMQLRGDRWTITRFAPKAEHTTPDTSTSIDLRFTLPFRGQDPVDICVSCKVVIIRRIAEQEYYVGLQYQFFEGRDYDQLEAFIDELEQRNS